MKPHTETTNNESATIELGEALFCEEKFEEALAVFREILDSEPANSAALNDAGITCGMLGDIEGSFDYFHAALQADRTCAPAFLNLLDLALSCEAVEAGRKIFILFHRGIAECNEKTAFEDVLFSPEMDALIEERRKQAAAMKERGEDSPMSILHMVNQQTQHISPNAA